MLPCLMYWILIEKVNYLLTVYYCEAFYPSEGQSSYLIQIESPATEKSKREKQEEYERDVSMKMTLIKLIIIIYI